jgi:hypothetical protein
MPVGPCAAFLTVMRAAGLSSRTSCVQGASIRVPAEKSILHDSEVLAAPRGSSRHRCAGGGPLHPAHLRGARRAATKDHFGQDEGGARPGEGARRQAGQTRQRRDRRTGPRRKAAAQAAARVLSMMTAWRGEGKAVHGELLIVSSSWISRSCQIVPCDPGVPFLHLLVTVSSQVPGRCSSPVLASQGPPVY